MVLFVIHHLIIQSIEACSQDRIEKISNTIDTLNPFEEKRDFFATSILSESINLQFDNEGRISLSAKLLKHAKIKKQHVVCWSRQTISNMGTSEHLKNLRLTQDKKANLNRASLKWEKHLNK